MSTERKLTGAIVRIDKAAEKSREDARLKAAERRKSDRAKTIKSKADADSVEARQDRGELTPWRVQINGGVKLGTLEPMSVSVPRVEIDTDIFTGADPLHFPTYLISSSAGRSVGRGEMIVWNNDEIVGQERTDENGDIDPLTFDVEVVDVVIKDQGAVDLRYLWEHTGTPDCIVRDFDTLNSDVAEVNADVRLMINPHPTRVRHVRVNVWPFDQNITFPQRPENRVFFEALQANETYIYQSYPIPSITQPSHSTILAEDENGEVRRGLKTYPDHIMTSYTERFSTPDFPIRLNSELTYQDDGSSVTANMASLIFPGDNVAIIDISNRFGVKRLR